MTIDQSNKVFDVLKEYAGAHESMRNDFVWNHTSPNKCSEYRFQGKLGFGGKYRSERNTVDCYREDETPERLEIIRVTNKKLSEIKSNF